MLKRLQDLPEGTRYIILWGLVGAVGSIMIWWWVSELVVTLEEMEVPQVEKVLPAAVTEQSFELPVVEFPSLEDAGLTEELLRELELEIEQQQ